MDKLPSTMSEGTFLLHMKGKQAMPVWNGSNVASNVKWDWYLQKKQVTLSTLKYNKVESNKK